jgi:hypothetical protein
VQQGLDGTRRRQVEENAVLILFDLGRHLEQREHHGGRLGRRERGVGQRVGAQSMVEHRRTTCQEEPHGVGKEGRGGGAVAAEITLDRFDIVFTIPPGTIEVFIHLLGRWGLSGGHHKARLVPCRHDCGLDDHPPRLVPRGGGRGEVLIDAAAGGGLLAIGVSHGRLLPEQVTGGLHDWRRMAEEHGMASQAEDERDPAPLGEHLQHFWRGAMTVTAHENRGLRPVAPQIREEADQAHRIFHATGPLPRPEARHHSGMGGPCANAQRQRAITLIVMVREGTLLLAMRGVCRMVEVEDNRRGGLRVAGKKLVHKRLRETREIGAGHAVFEPRERRGTRQVLRGIQRAAFHAQLQQGIIPQTVGIIAVRIARGALIDALREEVPEGMGNIRRVALVAHGGSQALREADLAVDAPQQERAKVRRQSATLKIGPYRMACEGRKMQLLWCRIGHEQTSCGFYGIGDDRTLFYQRLARGLCVFMKNSG